jgi:hypothetical protein
MVVPLHPLDRRLMCYNSALDVTEKKQIYYPYRESDLDPSVVQPNR